MLVRLSHGQACAAVYIMPRMVWVRARVALAQSPVVAANLFLLHDAPRIFLGCTPLT